MRSAGSAMVLFLGIFGCNRNETIVESYKIQLARVLEINSFPHETTLQDFIGTNCGGYIRRRLPDNYMPRRDELFGSDCENHWRDGMFIIYPYGCQDKGMCIEPLNDIYRTEF